MAIESILNALPIYKNYGKKYRAPCPVHDGKDMNLMISERADGSVGCHCFVCGANGLAVVDALGVNRDELFPPDSDYKTPIITREMQITYAQDSLVIAMAEKMPRSAMTLEDKRRLKLAQARREGIEQIKQRMSENPDTTDNKKVDTSIRF